MSNITNIKITPLHLSGKSVNFDCANIDIIQNFSPEWSSEAAYGKMDPIATYSRTTRTADIAFTVLAPTVEEAKIMQNDVDNFIRYNYPKYNGKTSLSAPPFFKIEMIHLRMLNVLEGYLTSLTITPGNQDGTVPLVSEGFFYERKYVISFNFQVLHNKVVGYIGNNFSGLGSNGFVYIKGGSPVTGKASQTPLAPATAANDKGKVTTVPAIMQTTGMPVDAPVQDAAAVLAINKRFDDYIRACDADEADDCTVYDRQQAQAARDRALKIPS